MRKMQEKSSNDVWGGSKDRGGGSLYRPDKSITRKYRNLSQIAGSGSEIIFFFFLYFLLFLLFNKSFIINKGRINKLRQKKINE